MEVTKILMREEIQGALADDDGTPMRTPSNKRFNQENSDSARAF